MSKYMDGYQPKYRCYCDFIGAYWSDLSESDFEKCGYFSDDDPQCYNCPYCREVDENGREVPYIV